MHKRIEQGEEWMWCPQHLGILYILEVRRRREGLAHAHSRVQSRTFEALPTMPHAFLRTTASFEEGNMAKWQKLEPEFEEVSEPSQLSGPSPNTKVHCVVTAI